MILSVFPYLLDFLSPHPFSLAPDLNLRPEHLGDLWLEMLPDDPSVGLPLRLLLISEGFLTICFFLLKLALQLQDGVQTRFRHVLRELVSYFLDSFLFHNLFSFAFRLSFFPSFKVIEFMNPQVGNARMLSHPLLSIL